MVRSSRSPALGKLTPAEVKKSAARARKLYDKWLALSRGQSRTKSKKMGFGESKANTSLKLEIFGDALKSFDDKLAKLGTATGPKKKAKTKKSRAAGHRATRAEVRANLRSEMDGDKESPKKSVGKTAKKNVAKKKVPKKTTKKDTPKKSVANTSSAAPSSKKKVKKSTKKTSRASQPAGNSGLGSIKKKVRQAKTAAKKSRIERSGLDSRVLGHVSARGKRAQARRDSKG